MISNTPQAHIKAHIKLKHLKFGVFLFYAVHPKMNLKYAINVAHENCEMRFEIDKSHLKLYHSSQFTNALII